MVEQEIAQLLTRPYPGLRPFEEGEGEIFFGREDHIDRLLEILEREHFLSVTGPSGSGKSSLVRAGLLPMLSLRTIGGGKSWRYAYMRPGDKPIGRLASALLSPAAFGRELGQEQNSGPDYSVQRVEAELRRGPLALQTLAEDARRQIQNEDDRDTNLLILIDQFEEIFTYAQAGANASDEADALVDLLLHAHDAREAGVFVILTMRSDFLGDCVRFLNLPDTINRSQYLTPRMRRDQLSRAIIHPARMFGGDLEPALAEELVNAIDDKLDQLPVLQHALARMWDRAVAGGNPSPRLGLADLKGVGGVSRALADHAQEILEQLNRREQSVAEWLFRAITKRRRSTESGWQVVRRPQSLARIAAWSGMPWERFLPVLDKFADPAVNFLTFAKKPESPGSSTLIPADGAATVIDISHEALMRQWELLRDWIACEYDAQVRFEDLVKRADGRGDDVVEQLMGNALKRASDWLETGLQYGGEVAPEAPLRPSPAWAARMFDRDISGGIPPMEDSAAAGRQAFGNVVRFIDQSDKAARTNARRERRLKWSLYALVCFSGLLLLSAGIGRLWNARQSAYRLKTDQLWGPFRDVPLEHIGRAGESREDEILGGLLRLARAEPAERERFIDKGLDDRALRNRLLDTMILRATVGIDGGIRDRLLRKLESPVISQARLTVPANDQDSDARVTSTSETMAMLWLGGMPHPTRLVEAMSVVSDSASLEALSASLRDAMTRDSAGVTQATDFIMAEIGQAGDARQHTVLATSLGLIGPRMDRSQRDAVVADLLTMSASAPSWAVLSAARQGVAALAPYLDSASATRLSTRVVDDIAGASGSSGTPIISISPPLFQRLNTAALRILAARVTDSLLVASGVDRMRYSRTLAMLAERLDSADLRALRARLGAAGRASADRGRSQPLNRARETASVRSELIYSADQALRSGVVGLRGLVSSRYGIDTIVTGNNGALVVPEIVRRMELTDDPSVLASLTRRMREHAPTVDSDLAAAQVKRLIALSTEETDPDQLDAFASSVEALASRIRHAEAQLLVDDILAGVSRIGDSDGLEALSKEFSALVTRLETPALPPLLGRVRRMSNASITLNSGTYDELQGAIAGLLAPGDADVQFSATLDSVMAHWVTPLADYNTTKTLQRIGNSLRVARTSVCGFLDSSPNQFNAFSKGLMPRQLERVHLLSRYASRLEARRALVYANTLLDIADTTVNPAALCAIGDPLGALEGRLTEAGATAFRQRISAFDTTPRVKITAWADTSRLKVAETIGGDTAFKLFQYLESGARSSLQFAATGGLLASLPAPTAAHMLPGLLEQINAGVSDDRIYARREIVQRGISRIDSARTPLILDALASVMQGTSTFASYNAARAASTLLGRASLDSAQAKTWISASRHPFLDRTAVAAAIGRRFPEAPHRAGMWSFFTWATRYFQVPDAGSLSP